MQAPWKLRSLLHSASSDGFHKLLQYNISIDRLCSPTSLTGLDGDLPLLPCLTHREAILAEGNSEHRDAATVSSGTQVASGCQLAIIQALPAALYADVDELHNLQPSVTFTTRLFGRLPAQTSRLHSECSQTSFSTAALSAQSLNSMIFVTPGFFPPKTFSMSL